MAGVVRVPGGAARTVQGLPGPERPQQRHLPLSIHLPVYLPIYLSIYL